MKLIVFFLIITSFFPTIGSNTGLSKNNLILYVPIIFSLLNIQLNYNQYKAFFISFLIYVFVLRIFNFIDYSTINSDFSFNNKKLYPTISNSNTTNKLKELDKFLNNKNTSNIYFYGMDGHFFEYYYNSNIIFKSFDRNLDNENEWNRFSKELIDNKDIIYLFIPEFAITEKTKQSIFIKNINKYKTSNYEVAGFFVFQFK